MVKYSRSMNLVTRSGYGGAVRGVRGLRRSSSGRMGLVLSKARLEGAWTRAPAPSRSLSAVAVEAVENARRVAANTDYLRTGSLRNCDHRDQFSAYDLRMAPNEPVGLRCHHKLRRRGSAVGAWRRTWPGCRRPTSP